MFEADNETLEDVLILKGSHQTIFFTGNLLLTLTSLLFNSVVLYGAVNRQALKSDHTTVLLLEFLTVLDLLITLFSVVPLTIVSYSGRWILGESLCVANAVARRYLYLTELMVISYISLYRLSLVMVRKSRPVKRGPRRKRNRLIYIRLILIVMVMVTLPLFPLLTTFSGDSKVKFEPGYMSCTVPETAIVWGYVSLAFLVVPSGIVILSNLVILYKVIRIKMRPTIGLFSGLKNAINPGTMRKSVSSRVRKINPSTYITICFICIFFVISYSPVFVIIAQGETQIIESPEPHWLGFLTVELLSLNVLSNPIVYTLSNMRFRRYVMSLLKCKSMNSHAGATKRHSPQSSAENVFNETISKFFSTATRRNSAFTPSVSNRSSRQNSISRTTLAASRTGPQRRRSEYDQPMAPSGKWCSPGPGMTDRRTRKISSTCSIMPNLEEDETMSFFNHHDTSQLRSASEVISSNNRLSFSSPLMNNKRASSSSYSDMNSARSSLRPSIISTGELFISNVSLDPNDNPSIRRQTSDPCVGNGNLKSDCREKGTTQKRLKSLPISYLVDQSNTSKSNGLPFIVVDEHNHKGVENNFVAFGALIELHCIRKDIKAVERSSSEVNSSD